jgi:hypothetical protein
MARGFLHTQLDGNAERLFASAAARQRAQAKTLAQLWTSKNTIHIIAGILPH